MTPNIRKFLEEKEEKYLSSKAALSSKARRALKKDGSLEKECDFRTAFQKDRDKILHSKSFRRLKHKTQVFFSPPGDHYRTRMTHTLEVMQVGRTIARALNLNEDLVEAASLGHDLGHPPFGHAGEAILNKISSQGFHHSLQSLRVVDVIENNGQGLNLTQVVREAIEKHSKGKGSILSEDPQFQAKTLEGQIVRLSDVVAYVNHDLDDAKRAGVLKEEDIPKELKRIFGQTRSSRIETMIQDVIEETLKYDLDRIRMSAEKLDGLMEFRRFMFEHVYETERVYQEMNKIQMILKTLYEYYMKHQDQLLLDFEIPEFRDSIEQHVIDYISGMTDRYAISKYQEMVKSC